MSDFIEGQEVYAFRATVSYDVVDDSGLKITRHLLNDITLRHPNKLYVRSARDDGDGPGGASVRAYPPALA